MNTILSVSVDFLPDLPNADPVIKVLFDEINYDRIAYWKKDNNLLGIHGDLASHYHFTSHFPKMNQKVMFHLHMMDGYPLYGSELWTACSEATNMIFPDVGVIEVWMTDNEEDFNKKEVTHFNGIVVSQTVLMMLKQQGYRVGEIASRTGFKVILPLTTDGKCKEIKGSKLLKEI